MSKNKRKQKPKGRPYLIPMDYVNAVADEIWRNNPDKQTISNTLAGFGSVFFTRGYSRRQADELHFRNARKRTLKQSWDTCITQIEDLIHPKPQISK